MRTKITYECPKCNASYWMHCVDGEVISARCENCGTRFSVKNPDVMHRHAETVEE